MRSKVNEFRKLMIETLNTYYSIDNAIREMHKNIGYLGEVTCGNSAGDKLIKAGIFCVAGIPEPVISNTLGAILIATGAYVRRIRGIDLRKLPITLGKHTTELEKNRRILHGLKI